MKLDDILAKFVTLATIVFVGCQSNAIIIDNCNNACRKAEDALGQMQQVRDFIVDYANNGQTNISSDQMMKQIMPKANIAANLLAEAGEYLNECVVQDDSLFKLRGYIQSLAAYEDRLRTIYTLCNNKRLMSITGYDNEIQLIITSLDNTANSIVSTVLSIEAFSDSL